MVVGASSERVGDASQDASTSTSDASDGVLGDASDGVLGDVSSFEVQCAAASKVVDGSDPVQC